MENKKFIYCCIGIIALFLILAAFLHFTDTSMESVSNAEHGILTVDNSSQSLTIRDASGVSGYWKVGNTETGQYEGTDRIRATGQLKLNVSDVEWEHTEDYEFPFEDIVQDSMHNHSGDKKQGFWLKMDFCDENGVSKFKTFEDGFVKPDNMSLKLNGDILTIKFNDTDVYYRHFEKDYRNAPPVEEVKYVKVYILAQPPHEMDRTSEDYYCYYVETTPIQVKHTG